MAMSISEPEELTPAGEYAGHHMLLEAFARQWLMDARARSHGRREQAQRDFRAASRRPGELIEALAFLTGREPRAIIATIETAASSNRPRTQTRVKERRHPKCPTRKPHEWRLSDSKEMRRQRRASGSEKPAAFNAYGAATSSRKKPARCSVDQEGI